MVRTMEKLYSSPKMLLGLLYSGLLFSVILNSSLIFKFNWYSLIGSISATIFYILFILLQIRIKEKINIISINNLLYTFLLVMSGFLYTHSQISNSIMFSFSITTLGISLVFHIVLRRELEKSSK